jgi:hypothetical protein
LALKIKLFNKINILSKKNNIYYKIYLYLIILDNYIKNDKIISNILISKISYQ